MCPDDSPVAPPRKKKDRSIARYSDGIQPRATITHDRLAEEYRNGARDALRSIILAAQAALAKHGEPQSFQLRKPPRNEGSHEQQ